MSSLKQFLLNLTPSESVSLAITCIGLLIVLFGRHGSRRKIRQQMRNGILTALIGACLTSASFQNSVTANENEISSSFDYTTVPAYSGKASVEINGNVPFFTEEDLQASDFEEYGELDHLGRCTGAYAMIGQEMLPEEKRGSIGMIKPSGWHTIRYDDLIADKYLYNRCHLIAYSLTGENANEKNLITGTRYMNTEGMMEYENRTLQYIRKTGHHVLYRSTPVFEGNDLVARGVLLEARSVEDEGICFCVFCYNVQPGITIDYASGESQRTGEREAGPALKILWKSLKKGLNIRLSEPESS